MTYGRLIIRHISCVGPDVEPATVTFRAGANGVVGLSNTGKSYIRDILDFMLGGEKVNRLIPEAEQYDTALLGLELSDGLLRTLRRPLIGGDFEVLDGLFEARRGGAVVEILAFKARKKVRAASDFYLQAIGMEGGV